MSSDLDNKLDQWDVVFKRPEVTIEGDKEEIKDFLQIIQLLKQKNVEDLQQRLYKLEDLLKIQPVLKNIRFDLDRLRRAITLKGRPSPGDKQNSHESIFAFLADEAFYQQSLEACQRFCNECIDHDMRKSIRFAMFFLKGKQFFLNHTANNPLLELVYKLTIDDHRDVFESMFLSTEVVEPSVFDPNIEKMTDINKEIIRMETKVLEAIFSRKLELPLYFDELIAFYLQQKLHPGNDTVHHEHFLNIFKTDLDICLREKFLKRIGQSLTFPLQQDPTMLELLRFFLASGLIRVPFFLCFTAFKNGDYYIRFHEEHRLIRNILVASDTHSAISNYAEYYRDKGYQEISDRLWVKLAQFGIGPEQVSDRRNS